MTNDRPTPDPTGSPDNVQTVSHGRATQKYLKATDGSIFLNITMSRAFMYTVTMVDTETGMTHFVSEPNDTIQAGLDEFDAWAASMQEE